MMAKYQFKGLTHRAVELYSKLLPNPCFLCQLPSHSSALCPACIADLPALQRPCPHCAMPLGVNRRCQSCDTHPPLQQATFCALPYQTPVDRLITAFKFEGRLELATVFADLMIQQRCRSKRPLPEVLIPIPLHPWRLRSRGFNQAHELAKVLRTQLGIAVNDTALSRTRRTETQSALSLSQRAANLRGAFACPPLAHRHIALIDDVLTTGHTSREAVATLMQAGATAVEVWTVARA